MLHVISLGGSIIAPDNVDTGFCRSFFDTIVAYLQKDDQHKVIIVCGGGAPARRYQKAYRDLSSSPEAALQDLHRVGAGLGAHGVEAQAEAGAAQLADGVEVE